MPSSFYFKNVKLENAPKAKVKYFVKAHFMCSTRSPDNMKFKQVLIVRERPKLLSWEKMVTMQKDITIFMCCPKGLSEVTCKFSKNVFTPNEEAQGEIFIDNSRCRLPVRSVMMELKQVLI